jgi:hypothetical protein
MATNPPKRHAPKPNRSVTQWLLDSDPSIRWQVLCDLTDAPADEVAAERARVATEGAGARLLALQGADGRWPLEVRHSGEMPVETDDGVGRPSRWNTLRALRVLGWYSTRD